MFQDFDSELALRLVVDTDEDELVTFLVEQRGIAFRRPCRATTRHALEQHDVAHCLGDPDFFGCIGFLLIDAIHEMNMIVVTNERVATLRDRSGSRLIALAARLRRAVERAGHSSPVADRPQADAGADR